VPSFRPFRRPSLRAPSRPPRHVASLPGPAGYTPPLDGSRQVPSLRPSTPESLGSCPPVQGSVGGVVTAP
jgi:hypothetical protein